MEHDYNEKEKQRKSAIKLNDTIANNEGNMDMTSPLELGPEIPHYNQENGDLFYGLATKRGRYIKSANPDFDSTKSESIPMIIDVYNNSISKNVWDRHTGKDPDEIDKEIEKLFDDPKKYSRNIKVSKKLQQDVISDERGWYPLWNDYFNTGKKNPKFNLSKIYEKTASKYDSDYYHSWALSALAPKLLWKRGSKLGIEMAAKNGRTKIHFVLDGLNIEQVVNKTKGSDSFEAGPGESITASELRYAYRNRERLGDRIHFYKDDKEAIAPWDENPELWQNYMPKSNKRNVTAQGNSERISRLNTLFGRVFSSSKKRS
ncbi:hypothetical protein [Photorhabdus heterorhabditis]|uniref:hypothetical protein n=1 Tax=Photorhabdus heterorhabditis TaxID=880156 RepID=UPI001BD2FD15|nr:hypothetical protein [Photorhabdus heterorhabditis]MBS9440749.1 hypothetical protein [Photorhabdus heterorhabditis]